MTTESGRDWSNHLYGIGGLVPGLISLVFLVQSSAPWQQYALLASGWVAAAGYGFMVLRALSVARADGKKIGELSKELEASREKSKLELQTLQLELGNKINNLERECIQKGTLIDYLAGLAMGTAPIPRSTRNSDDDQKGN